MTSPTYAPRLMRTPEAARYLGISATTLRRLGLPTRRLADNCVVYDRHDLDRYADALPPADAPQGGQNTCDAILEEPER